MEFLRVIFLKRTLFAQKVVPNKEGKVVNYRIRDVT